MGKILNVDTIHVYNIFSGIETMYSLVSFIDFLQFTKEL